MENGREVIWVSVSSRSGDQENRILDLLRSNRIPVCEADRDSLSIYPADGELLVVNATGDFGNVEPLLRRVVETLPGAQILVRCEINSFHLKVADRFQNVGLLDAQEGPELVRSRICGTLSTRREPSVPQKPEWRKAMIGDSASMQKVADVIRLVGPRRCTVLITGETGTGKEVVAKAIHKAGPRTNEPFVAINCSALPAALLEAELFGHTRGAFTGATQVRVGRFEQAHGGTLFLDEIGDLPIDLQAKLLRVLQEREIQKLGSSETVRVDVRVVAATNCDLRAKVAEGSFREDLFYRLNVVPLELPPLRARISDVRALVDHFLTRACQEEQLAPKSLTEEAWTALECYDWPGNVRQLENAISSAVILSDDRRSLHASDFSLPSVQKILPKAEWLGPVALPEHGLDFTKTVSHLERELLSQALRKTNGNKKAAAQMLRLKRTTLSAKVRVLELHEGAA